jgi:hypothetical protein
MILSNKNELLNHILKSSLFSIRHNFAAIKQEIPSTMNGASDSQQAQVFSRDAEGNVVPNVCAACVVCECWVCAVDCCRQDSFLDFETIPLS